jgi:N-acyl-phosphatidylethanolamine-hydrolysing phospholipase D
MIIMKKVKLIFIAAFCAFLLNGCWPLRTAYENIGRVFTDSPEKIPNKIKDPIKENVRLSALWIGHASVLVQIEDKVFIVDPSFNDVIGGIALRLKEPGLEIADIPKLDFVLISHAHMDHMSIGSIADLDDKFPTAKLIFPAGVEDYLPGYKMDMIRMKEGKNDSLKFIGETKEYDGVKITTIYVRHFGGRYGLDSYAWNVPGCTAYIFEYKGVTVFYAGDTAFDELTYKWVSQKYKINLALIPIGPCGADCDSLGNRSHVASRGALMMFDDLKADYMLPVHYGAIKYSGDSRQPLYVLEEIIAKEPHYKDKIIILNEGQQYIFEYK